MEQDLENEKLETKNLQKNMATLLGKIDGYKRLHDRYLSLMNFIEKINKDTDIEESMMIMGDSSELIYIDKAYPTVSKMGCQKDVLQDIKKGGAATRALMDFIFENEEISGKNCKQLEAEYPEKIGAIKNYIKSNYPEFEMSKITKSITGKCGKKLI